MPIDRPDGRHWCAPEDETPDEHGTWTCTCGNTWQLLDGVWILEADVETHRDGLAQATSDSQLDESA